MPTLKLLDDVQKKNFDSAPKLTDKQRLRYFAVNGEAVEYLNNMRDTTNQVGFLIQIAYFRASGKFFPNDDFRKIDVKYACSILNIDFDDIAKDIKKYSSRCRTMHKNYILDYSGWQKYTQKFATELHEELSLHAKQQMHPKYLLPIATNYLIAKKIELPQYYVLAETISDVYNKMEEKLVVIVEKSLSKGRKEILDDLIWIDNRRHKSYKYSALSRIKQFCYSTKIKMIEESIKNYRLLKVFYNEFGSVYQSLELSEAATTYYSEWVNKSKLFQLKQFKNRSRAYLYLLAHIKHQYFRQTDLYVDILLKLIRNSTNAINKNLEKHSINLLRNRKRLSELLSSTHNDSKEAFKKILNILDDQQKSQGAKGDEIRLVVLDQLDHKKDKANDDLLQMLNQNFSSQDLKNKLLRSMGSSLQRKLTPIICELDFEHSNSSANTYNAIRRFVDCGGKITQDNIKEFFSSHETKLVSNSESSNALICKAILFEKIFNSIKTGSLSLLCSYNYLPIRKYLINDERWEQHTENILKTTGLNYFASSEATINSLNDKLSEKYQQINESYNNGGNKHLSFNKEGKFIISTPKAKNEKSKNKLTPIFAQEGIIPISNVLDQINNVTNFVKCFKHHAIKKVIMKPTSETIFAGVLSKGCNHGTIKMANISKGVNKATLSNTINWFFNLENVQEANNTIVDYINKLSLPEIYRWSNKHSHTSSDGQKFNVGVDSILANYSFKYFGQSQGISAYTFIDDRQVLFYDTILSPGTREAAFVIDGLMANNVVKSYIHSTDTHGFSEAIFAVMHLLGISFAPRIKKVGSQLLYSIESTKTYKKKDYKIKPNKKINIALIKSNWDDILRLIATIKTKTVTASQIFSRLNSYTKEPLLYKALKEFGRIIKTTYILTYIDDPLLRQQIEKQLNIIELSNKFARAVFFANSQEFRVGSTTDQRIIVACRSFIQNCIVLWNYLYLSQLLVNHDEKDRTQLLKTIKEGSVISWQHVNLHGEYDFTAANDPRFNVVFDLDQIKGLKVA